MRCLSCWSAAAIFFVSLLDVAGARASEPARGAELLAPFKRDLQQALRQGLDQGAVEAISACQLKAPAIAQEQSQGAVRVGRASHRLRNPANVAPDWVAPILSAYLEDAANRAAQTVVLPGGVSGYVEPILAQPLCLTCHGETLAPPVAARIRELYPDDRAVGFEAGDLRGVFWIEYLDTDAD